MMRFWRVVLLVPVLLSQLLPLPYAAAPARAQASCALTAFSTSPLPITPLDKDAAATLDLVIAPGGNVSDVTIVLDHGSGDAARDAALLVHVRENWRYAPRKPECGAARARLVVHYLHTTCAPQPLEETQTPPEIDYQDRPRAVELQIGVVSDGTVAIASVTRSSGDAALDAAAVAHVMRNWRWQPYVCPTAKSPVTMGTATVNFPYLTPGTPP